VAQVARALGERAKAIGAWLLQADPADVTVAEGCVFSSHGRVTLREIARAWYLQPQHLPPNVDRGGLEVTAGYRAGRDSGTFSYSTHAAAVAVDPVTGLVEVLDYVVVEDGGTLINPMIVDGQIRGGAAQGIGTCLFEEVPFDARGQLQVSTLLDYVLPGATEVPNVRVLHMNTPSPHTEFGMKGIGEGGAVGGPAAIVGAVNDALRPLRPRCTTCRSPRRASSVRSPPPRLRLLAQTRCRRPEPAAFDYPCAQPARGGYNGLSRGLAALRDFALANRRLGSSTPISWAMPVAIRRPQCPS
jgi:xanthine dehydrogenase molybdopterin-binding subunit B